MIIREVILSLLQSDCLTLLLFSIYHNLFQDILSSSLSLSLTSSSNNEFNVYILHIQNLIQKNLVFGLFKTFTKIHIPFE